MKRSLTILIFTCAILLLSSTFASAENIWETESTYFKSAGKTDNIKGTDISPDYYGKLLTINGSYGWFKTTAPANGTFYITCRNATSMTCLFSVKDKNTFETTGDGHPVSFAIKDINEGETIYWWLAADYSGNRRFGSDVDIVICFDGYHDIVNEHKVVKEATCSEPGCETDSYCLVCSAPFNVTEIPVLEHTPSEDIIVTESTCLASGTSNIACTVCSEILDTTTLPLKDHTLGEMAITANATCTSDGNGEQRCTSCNALLASEVIPAYGHKEGSWYTTKEATCTEPGTSELYCSECNVVLNTSEIASIGHVGEKWIVTKEPSCTTAGTRELRCSNCDICLETEAIASLGHSVGELQTIIDPLCHQAGKKVATCSICDEAIEEEEIPALGHSYTEWETTKEATKNSEGERTRHCIHCGDTIIETIPKLKKFLGIF